MRANTPAVCAAAVLFEAELSFQGVEDRLDALADRGEAAVTAGFVPRGPGA